MARPDLAREANRSAVKRVLKWLGVSVLAVLLIAVIGVITVVVRFTSVMHKHFAALGADAAAMQRPENYKPAELYLARLMQSDPALWKSDNQDPPDWLPPELGKLNPSGFSSSYEVLAIGGGGGLDDFFGYHLDRAPAAPGASTSVFTLRYLGGGKELVMDQLTLPTSDHLDVEEFVKLALAELARRQAAFANGTQPNLYRDDPIADRQRLLAQHPAVAAKLGYTVPATRPAMSLRPG